MSIVFVGLGGALGSILRYIVATWLQTASKSLDFPFGTLAVNLIGCFVVGFLSQLAESRGIFTPEARALVFIGILGGFTTFSSFGNDTFNLARDNGWWSALFNISANVVIGLALVWFGRALAYWIWK